MYETQLLKIRIKPGKTEHVVEFFRTLQERESQCLDALRREGMVVESIFLERHDQGDFLYYYVKARNLLHANEVNLRATDALTLEIRQFVMTTWDHIVSPEPLLDIDLIKEEAAELEASVQEISKPIRARRKIKTASTSTSPSHALAG